MESKDFVGVLQYHNEVFATLDSPFYFNIPYAPLRNFFPSKISNVVAKFVFYRIEPEIIHGTYMYTN